MKKNYLTPNEEVLEVVFLEDVLGPGSAGTPGTPGSNDDIIDDGDLD